MIKDDLEQIFITKNEFIGVYSFTNALHSNILNICEARNVKTTFERYWTTLTSSTTTAVPLPDCQSIQRIRFYRATAKHTHGLAIDILSVRPSVRLSVKRVYCDKTR